MGVLAVLVAAAASYAWGAVWSMTMAGRWMAAAGLRAEDIDRRDMKPFVVSGVASILVAGMMRHILASSGIVTLGGALMTGLGLGLFIVLPWIATNYAYGKRPLALTLIDGTYAVVGCTIMAVVLALF